MFIGGTVSSGAAATTGSITGTVTGGNGAAVTIKIFASHGGKGQGKGASAAAGKHPHRPTAIATASTDTSGNFTVSNLPDGQYIVVAFLKGTGLGHAKADLTGASVSVNISLQAHKLRKNT
jgi:uncharacterized protein (DUF2141 family)